MDKLESIYDKKINKIYARWKLANEKQMENESMDAYVLRLMTLAKDCNFEEVSAVQHRDESVLQSFVSGLEDNYIRQRILENDVVTLEDALKCADILKRAKVNAGKYESSETFQSTVATIGKEKAIPDTNIIDKEEIDHVAAVSKPFKSKINRFSKCHNCGDIHAPLRCPAYGKTCFKCGSLNHWSKCCRKTKQMAINSILATLNKNGRKLCSASVLAPSIIEVEINGKQIRCLLDTGASECFMTPRLAKELNLKVDRKFKGSVALADKTQKSDVKGKVSANIKLGNEKFLYKDLNFTLVSNLVKDVIIGLKVLSKHQSITLELGGKHKPLMFKPSVRSHLSVMCSKVDYPTLFPGITKETKPVKMASRRYSKDERNFIAAEIKHLLEMILLKKAYHLGGL